MPRRRLALLAFAVVLAAVGAALVAPHSPAGLQALAADAGPWAPVALVLAWIVLTPALFPGTVLAAAGGLVFGLGGGLAVSLAGATLGAGAAFLLARAGRGRHALRARGRIGAVQEQLERRGFVSVLALRIAPGVPATLLNHAAGLSRIRTRHFLAGVTLGGAPRVAVYTLLGAGLASPSAGAFAAIVGGMAVVTGAGLGVAWAARRRGAAPLPA